MVWCVYEELQRSNYEQNRVSEGEINNETREIIGEETSGYITLDFQAVVFQHLPSAEEVPLEGFK